MGNKRTYKKCALILVGEGFKEIEMVVILSTLRQAGICAKSVGLTSGAITGMRGISVVPDLTLSELEHTVDLAGVGLLILPGDERGLARFEPDPRVHQLLRQVMACGGLLAAPIAGQPLFHAALKQTEGYAAQWHERVILWEALAQPLEAFAQDLAYRMQ